MYDDSIDNDTWRRHHAEAGDLREVLDLFDLDFDTELLGRCSDVVRRDAALVAAASEYFDILHDGDSMGFMMFRGRG